MGKKESLTFTEINFDPVGHLYQSANGAKLPSYSEIWGYFNPNMFAGIPTNILERKKHLGKACHLATEYLDKGILDEDSLDEEQRGYLNAYKDFKESMGFKPKYLEPHLVNVQYQYCCTPDKMGLLKGEWAIVELKTGVLMPSHEVQVQAQAECIKERVKKYVLCLKADGKWGIHPYNDKQRNNYIRNVWLSMVTVFHHLKKEK